MSTALRGFAGLRPKLLSSYKAALKSGEIVFKESELDEVEEEGIPFELRLVEGLNHKPTPQAPALSTTTEAQGVAETAKKDPFEPPYVPSLLVAEDIVKEDEDDEGQAFVVLLNKYSIVARHFLLVTKEFEPQSMPLTPVQLLAAYSILKQLGSREKHLAFFNSGKESGASQPHKHIQFIPLSNGVAPMDSFIAAHSTPKSPFQLPLPYANFTCLINDPPANPDRLAPYLGNIFMALLDLVVDHLRRLALSTSTSDQSLPVVQKFSQLSYNVIMTEAYLHIVPRTREYYSLVNATTKAEEKISINSLGYAGMMLLKNQEALDGVKEEGVLKVLSSCGYSPVALGDMPETEEM